MTKNNLFVTKPKEKTPVAKAEFYCATVTEVTTDGIRILIDGEQEPTTKAFKQLNPEHEFSTGDRVVAMLQSGTYVILGRSRCSSSDQQRRHRPIRDYR